jgi:hypothetical protein
MIDLKYGHLFLWHVRLGAVLAILLSIGMVTSSLIAATILFLGCVFVLTASEGTDINPSDKTFREYSSFFFLKTGRFEPLGAVEYIFINKGSESHQMSSPRGINTIVVENTIFNAYLKLSSGEKIPLLKEKNKFTIIKKLQALSEQLPADIVDHS